MFKYFIWDFDGTLFDTYPGLANTFLYVLHKDYKKEFDYEKILEWCKESIGICCDNLSEKLNINREKLMNSFLIHYKEIGPPVEEPPFPYAKEICEKVIAKGGLNFLVTHRSYYTLNRLLEKYNAKKYFKELISGDDNFPRKPAPSSFNYLLSKYRISEREVLAIGDRDLDIQAAKNAGIKSCYFNCDGHSHPDANYQIKELKELEKLL
jgi:HAD superfamily hydrolase (TIGR01549 family)